MGSVGVSSVADLDGGVGGDVGRDACDGVRVGRVDWVRVHVGNHDHVEGEPVGGKLVHSQSQARGTPESVPG